MVNMTEYMYNYRKLQSIGYTQLHQIQPTFKLKYTHVQGKSIFIFEITFPIKIKTKFINAFGSLFCNI